MLTLQVTTIRIVGEIIVFPKVRHAVIIEVDTVNKLGRISIISEEWLFPIGNKVLISIDIRNIIEILI